MLNREHIIPNDILIDESYRKYYVQQLRSVVILETAISKMKDLEQNVLRVMSMLSLQEAPAAKDKDMALLNECFLGIAEEIVSHQRRLEYLKLHMERESINYNRLKTGTFYTPQYALFPNRPPVVGSSLLAELGNEHNHRVKKTN